MFWFCQEKIWYNKGTFCDLGMFYNVPPAGPLSHWHIMDIKFYRTLLAYWMFEKWAVTFHDVRSFHVVPDPLSHLRWPGNALRDRRARPGMWKLSSSLARLKLNIRKQYRAAKNVLANVLRNVLWCTQMFQAALVKGLVAHSRTFLERNVLECSINVLEMCHGPLNQRNSEHLGTLENISEHIRRNILRNIYVPRMFHGPLSQ